MRVALLAVQVMQRGLPRPMSLMFGLEVKAGADSQSLKEAAELVLYREMLSLLEHDAAKYPVKESKKDKRVSPHALILGCRSGSFPACLALLPTRSGLRCVNGSATDWLRAET